MPVAIAVGESTGGAADLEVSAGADDRAGDDLSFVTGASAGSGYLRGRPLPRFGGLDVVDDASPLAVSGSCATSLET